MKAEKRVKSKRRAKQGYFDVTEADYQSSLAKGLDEETLLKPGRHKFIRGGFKKMHPDYDAKTAKVKISIYIDQDILNHFRARAEQANAAPYQTQINNVLREAMEKDLAAGAAQQPSQAAVLVNDSGFIAAVARQVAASLKSRTKSGRRTKEAAQRSAPKR